MINNQFNSGRKLPTNRSLVVFMIRGVCSFTILAWIDMWQMHCDLNTIVRPYTSKRSDFLFFGIFGILSCTLMNEEMKRRGINYKLNFNILTYMISPFYREWKMMTALNLLSADYNEHGC